MIRKGGVINKDFLRFYLLSIIHSSELKQESKMNKA